MNPATFISKYEPQLYSIMRIVTGFLLLWHGSQKLFAFPPGTHESPAYIMFIAGPIEFLGGILIMIGLWTRWAAFVCSGMMAYAYWSAHGTQAVLPSMNGGELAIIYCFVFLFMAARGSGILSIDHFLEKRKQS